jgi:flagellar biosynthesis protein FliQ
MSTELVHPKLLIVSLVLASLVLGLLITAIGFEFYVEEMAKAFVVPILITAMFTTIATIGTLIGSKF